MDSTPKDLPIYHMTNAQYARIIQDTLFNASGGRDHLSHQYTPDGEVLSTHPKRLMPRNEDEEYRVHVGTDKYPPEDPLGPPKSMVRGLIVRHDEETRIRNGLTPTFSGGMTGLFGVFHMALRHSGGMFGKILDTKKLGRDPKESQEIQALLTEWSDKKNATQRNAFRAERFRQHFSSETAPTYPQELADKLSALPEIQIKLLIGGKHENFIIPNAPVGDNGTCLAHTLLGLHKNAISLTDRPDAEVKQVIKGASNFAGILETTDRIAAYIEGELNKGENGRKLKKLGVRDTKALLRENGMMFDPHKAEAMIRKHAPLLKLMDVILPLVHAGGSVEPMLELIGEKTPKLPAIHNAEHGARLLDAILTKLILEEQDSVRTNDEDGEMQKLDAKVIRSYLRKSAHDRPFDVARLQDHPEVQKLLRAAAFEAEEQRKHLAESGYSADHNSLERALATYAQAVKLQTETQKRRDPVSRATTYKPNMVLRTFGAKGRPEGSLKRVIESGAGPDEIEHMLHDIIASFVGGPEPKRDFSQQVADAMEKRAQEARSDIPPLP